MGIYHDNCYVWINTKKQLHRDFDRPARIHGSGWDKKWIQLDNFDGMYIYHQEGKEWCQNGKLHRKFDLPASVMNKGDLKWYQYCRRYFTSRSRHTGSSQ
jgi:hypothetical protein